MRADELLGTLRARLGDEITYLEQPRRLSGGFFTENHAFRLDGAPPPWDGPMVVRLFPASAGPGLAGREAVVQELVADQGLPAPRVLLFEDGDRLAGRSFFVMQRLPGRPLMGGVGLVDLARSVPSYFRRLPDVIASVQAQLHALDALPLADALGSATIGVERWFAQLDAQIAAGAPGLEPALDWLVDRRPPSTARTLCHGDLWGGNVLVRRGRPTGIIDWTVATVAEPALDVGFTTMGLAVVPVDVPRPIHRAVVRIAGGISRRYVDAYRQQTNADLTNVPYYEALRCAAELSVVCAYRLAERHTASHDLPRPTWDGVADRMVDYFRERTGVDIVLP